MDFWLWSVMGVSVLAALWLVAGLNKSPVLDIEGLRRTLRTETGTQRIADLGQVHQGRIGHADCKVSVGIDQWEGMYFVWVSVTHQKNRAGRHIRIVRWPYSRKSATDLAGVDDDLRALENWPLAAPLQDTRGWFVKRLDQLSGRQHLGEYRFRSTLQDEPLYRGNSVATVHRCGGLLEVSLAEGRPAGVFILAQFPHAACSAVRQALAAYSVAAQGVGKTPV